MAPLSQRCGPRIATSRQSESGAVYLSTHNWISFLPWGENEGQLLVNRDASALWYPKLGLFLQERANAGRVYTLTIAPSGNGCGARIIRATTTDTVISCAGEKSEVQPNQKFVYDIRAKQLVGRVEYMPFGSIRVTRATSEGAHFVMTNDSREVTVDFAAGRRPELHITAATARASAVSTDANSQVPPPLDQYAGSRFGPSGVFRLAKIDNGSDSDCASAEVVVLERRQPTPQRHRLPPEKCDSIGPWALDGNRLWFGKTFYSGEGGEGTGGIGYFDATTKRFELIALPASVTPSAVTAILVQPDAVWVALALHWEYSTQGRGVLRYDRRAHTMTHFDIGGIGQSFVAFRDRIALIVENGVVFIRDGQITGFIVDQTTDGRLRMAEAFK